MTTINCDLNGESFCRGTSITQTISDRNNSSADRTFTWSFPECYIGFYADGVSPWIAPLVKGDSIAVSLSVSSSTEIVTDNIVIENPTNVPSEYGNDQVSDSPQGWFPDHEDYDASLRLSLPYAASGKTSLMALGELSPRSNAGTGYNRTRGQALGFTVLTVEEVPGDYTKKIRPNATSTKKHDLWLNQLDLSLFPSSSLFTGTTSADRLDIAERWAYTFESQGMQTAGEFLRAVRSQGLVSDYASTAARQWYDDVFSLMSDAQTIAQKTPAIASLLAYALDTYAALETGLLPGSGAGQHTGKLPSLLLLGALAKSDKYQSKIKGWIADIDPFVGNGGFQEIQQLRGHYSDPIHGDDRVQFGRLREYWSPIAGGFCFNNAQTDFPGTVCEPNSGNKASFDPHYFIDGPPRQSGATGAAESYIPVTLGPQRALYTLVKLMDKARQILEVIDDRVVRYVERYDDHGVRAAPDVCAPPDPRENFDPNNGAVCNPYHPFLDDETRTKAEIQTATNCVYIMDTWGPQENDRSKCILNNSGTNTGQTGRFSDRDGTAMTPLNTSAQVESNWTAIRNL